MPLELRRNEFRLRFLYKLRSNTIYAESLNSLDDREGLNYEENKGATRPTEVHLRKLEQRYIKEQRAVKENHLAQQSQGY